MIGIIDFGAGNLYSAYHAFNAFSSNTQIIKSPNDITEQTIGLVLPGDGSFPFAYNSLKKAGFVDYLRTRLQLPLLGICVGFQLLFDASDEDGGSEGLGLIAGKVIRFNPTSKNEKIPHIGWNLCTSIKESKLLKGVPNKDYYYFVHSFFAIPQNRDNELMTSNYIQNFCAGVEKGNLFGCQFHPEKSHMAGWKIIENFVSFCKQSKLNQSLC